MTDLRNYLLERVEAESPSLRASVETIARRAATRRRRRRNAAWLGAAALVAAAALVPQLSGGPDEFGGIADPSVSKNPSATPSADPRRGETKMDGAFACVETYSPSSLPNRGFAFDGTISSIGRPGDDPMDMGLLPVTFDVHEWFVGGQENPATVSMYQPQPASDDRPASYSVGTRLLVSGEPAEPNGAPVLGDAIAWGCGFTRYYDEDTADSWRDATED